MKSRLVSLSDQTTHLSIGGPQRNLAGWCYSANHSYIYTLTKLTKKIQQFDLKLKITALVCSPFSSP